MENHQLEQLQPHDIGMDLTHMQQSPLDMVEPKDNQIDDQQKSHQDNELNLMGNQHKWSQRYISLLHK
jgi:hypothetical protein